MKNEEEKVQYELKLADSLRPFFNEETGKFNEDFLYMKIQDIVLVDK